MLSRKELIREYQFLRAQTESLCAPLAIEDYVIQSSDDVSPPKWHLAHTTWFFETFLLSKFLKNYQPFHHSFQFLFNSYYQAIGGPYPRAKRGVLSRPTVETIYRYRAYVDEQMINLMNQASEEVFPIIQEMIILGIHHEQQHQELLLMDIKHNLSLHPELPAYRYQDKLEITKQTKLEYLSVPGGLVEIGYQDKNFCFDNELPRHQQFLRPFKIANRLVTNGEYLEFIQQRGYLSAEYWLSDGWDCVQRNQWQAPLYWQQVDNEWYVYTLNGFRSLDLNEPVVHVSFYEADAYARWRHARLPTGAEWEHFVTAKGMNTSEGNFIETFLLHPQSYLKEDPKTPAQFFGDVWEWTGTPYHPYPGYKPLKGALGEYNGKFMSNQMELRGGSCISSNTHIRATYRNFFQPDKRWQFSGIRLSSDE